MKNLTNIIKIIKDIKEEKLKQNNNLNNRFIIALTGPPASGKSTLALELNNYLNKDNKKYSTIISMDGFHLDDIILNQRNLRNKKGSIETFDYFGFESLIKRLKKQENQEIFIPVFDRNLELSKNAASVVFPENTIIIVEGNYLLINQKPWNNLKNFFDLSFYFDIQIKILRKRLMERWINLGFSEQEAKFKTEENDLKNAEFVRNNTQKFDFIIDENLNLIN